MRTGNAHRSAAEEFVQWGMNPTLVEEVRSMLDRSDDQEIEKRFGRRLVFGTAGLRGPMGAGYTYMNELVVLQTSQGLARYCETLHGSKIPSVVIGFDSRHGSEIYSRVTARVFLAAGWKVFLFSQYVGTPFIPFGVLRLNADLGIMITASHNPKSDNGYKVYWNNGAQIIPPHDEGIAKFIDQNLQPWQSLDLLNIWKEPIDYSGKELGEIYDPLERIRGLYMEEIMKNLCFHKKTNPESSLRICYTAMHGVGKRWVMDAFKAFNLPELIHVVEQVEPDPEFPTVAFPNPEEGKGALALSIETANRENCSLILANDPDADRLGVAEKMPNGDWRIFSGNDIAALLADWYWTKHKERNGDISDFSKCLMIASTVSSKFLQAMAEHEGFTFIDTLTGSKWMGNCAIDYEKKGYKFLFAYEVEIGFIFGNLSYDKDGIRTAAIFAEMAEQLRVQGKTCSQHLEILRQKYGYFEMKTSYFFCHVRKSMDELFSRLRKGFDGDYPKFMGKFKVKSIRDVTLGIDTAEPSLKSKLPTMPKDHMLTFRFENGAVATIRNSGTEPKIKYYVECKSYETPEQATLLLNEMTDALVNEFLCPEKYGLLPPKLA